MQWQKRKIYSEKSYRSQLYFLLISFKFKHSKKSQGFADPRHLDITLKHICLKLDCKDTV